MNKEGRGSSGSGKLILIGFVCVLYLLYATAVHVHGTLITFSQKLTSTPEGLQAVEAGAGALAEYIRSQESDIAHNGVLNLDNETVLRVLDAVEEYNTSFIHNREVTYEYMHYIGMVDEYDPETGLAKVSDYVMQEEATETHNAVEETLTDKVILSRTGIENAPELGGENVFELDWRPVLTLCAMIIQDRVEQYGQWDSDEDGCYLSEEDVQQVIRLFGYQYSYLDDGTAEEEWDGSFSRGANRNAAYRVEVSGDVTVGEVCDFSVRRVPQIAPKLIANSYLSYEYEYEKKENGEWILVARTVRVDGDSFVLGCSEMVEGFDPDLFVSEIGDLPGSERAVIHFGELADGKWMESRTEDPEQCPCIGTIVSAGGGFTVSHSRLFFAGRTWEGGDFRPQGADIAPAAMTHE